MKTNKTCFALALCLSVITLTACGTLGDLVSKTNDYVQMKNHPSCIVIEKDTYSMDTLTLDDIRDNYLVAVDEDNTIFAEIDGEARFFAGENQVVYLIQSYTEKISFFKGIKVGMKEKTVTNKLGDPSIDDSYIWYYDAQGNQLTGANALGATYELAVECDTTLLGWLLGNDEVIKITLKRFDVE